jgi:hypothetical protein
MQIFNVILQFVGCSYQSLIFYIPLYDPFLTQIEVERFVAMNLRLTELLHFPKNATDFWLSLIIYLFCVETWYDVLRF